MSLGYVKPLSGTANTRRMYEGVVVAERIQGSEVSFPTEDDLLQFAQWIGMPDL
jgi:hypothetical protein